MNTRPGYFVISLDFELHWGVRDTLSIDSYRDNILGGRQAIPKILKMFQQHGIHSTWAVVGLLFFHNKGDLCSKLPKSLPAYLDKRLSPYSYLQHIGDNEQSDPMHYAPSLIKQIASYEGQEIASHTFSHYYCLAPGQSTDTFRADLAAARDAAQALGFEVKSLVFPRNQCNHDYLAVCREQGFIAYRGNAAAWMYRATDDARQTLPLRLARFTDAYLNLSGICASNVDCWPGDIPVNLPASRFLRPVSRRLSLFEPLRLRRIKAEMSHAARQGLLYHLWWHPHNFGVNTEQNLSFLDKILDHYHRLQERDGMRSMNMGELAEQVIADRQRGTVPTQAVA